MKRNKISTSSNVNCIKSIKIKIMYSVQELYLCLLSSSDEVILASFTSLTLSVHSWVSLSTKFFLHLQFSKSKFSLTSHDLSHSHSKLLGLQINPLSHTPLSINSFHSHLYHHSNVVYYYKRVHLVYIYTFHAILCVLLHWFLTLN